MLYRLLNRPLDPQQSLPELILQEFQDRDTFTDKERSKFINDSSNNRMLERREVENYLFDKSVLKAFCTEKNVSFNEVGYDEIVKDIIREDLKPNQQKIQHCCSVAGDISNFKRDLAKIIQNVELIYEALEKVIFNR